MDKQVKATVDTSQIESALNKLRIAAGDQSVSLKEAALVLEDYVRGTFRQEIDPWGTPWHPLAPATLKARTYKDNFSQQIEIDSAKMFDSLDSTVTNSTADIFIGLDLIYTPVQQFGNDDLHIVARPFFPIREDDENAFPEDWINAVFAPIENALSEAVQ